MNKDNETKEERKRRLHREANRRYDSKPEVKARKKIYKKQYDIDNKKKNSIYRKKHHQKPEVKARIKKWREDNKEHIKEYRQTPEYKAKKREADKKYYHKKRQDPEHIKKERQRGKTFRKQNPKTIRAYHRKYNQSPKGVLESIRANHKRMSLRHKCKFKLTAAQIKQIYQRDKVCVYRGCTDNLELDHIIALSNGGDAMFENFVIACRKCNSSKNSKDVFKWCKEQKIKVPTVVTENLKKMGHFKKE